MQEAAATPGRRRRFARPFVLAAIAGAAWLSLMSVLNVLDGLDVLRAVAAAGQARADVEPAGWFAGDMHVHRSCGGPPVSVSTLRSKMVANRLAVISLLADMGNGEVQDAGHDLPHVTGLNDALPATGPVVHWDAEWHWDATYFDYAHQALGGHVAALGLTEAHQMWAEYTGPIFDWLHRQHAIGGFVHMEYLEPGIPLDLNCCVPVEYPVEVALGAADFIAEDVAVNDQQEGLIDAYYRLLNCGLRPGLAAGTDFPCNGGADLGSPLTYVQVANGPMTYRNWVEGIARGRTVISRNGHKEFLDLVVNGRATPGDEVALDAGADVPVTVRWTATERLSGTIELVHNGVVVASREASAGPGAPAILTAKVHVPASGWLAARRMDGSRRKLHTAAVFVTVNHAPVRASQADAEFYVAWIDTLLQRTAPDGVWSAYFEASREAARARYEAARTVFQRIASEASVTPPADPRASPRPTLRMP